MVMFSPIFVVLVYIGVLSLLYSVVCFLWWSGKRGYSF